jgi:nicotinamide-nucleotide amidase
LGKPSALDRAEPIIKAGLGRSIYSTSGETIEEVIVSLLSDRKETLAIAESCTGGSLANRITNVPGASEVFVAGYVCYANQAKIDMLDVDPDLIEKHGAVSEPVARGLAESARRRARTTYALATTGIAGPTGGSPDKPIGTAYIALASPGDTIVKKLFFPSDRQTFKDLVAQAGFDLLRRKIFSISIQ